MNARFARELATVGLRPHTFVVLTDLARDRTLTSAELARRLQVTSQSMSALLRSLADAGWVDRPDTARRGQRVDVRLTEVGHAALLRAGPVLADLAQHGVLGLSAAEAVTLRALLHRAVRALAAPRTERPPAPRGGGPCPQRRVTSVRPVTWGPAGRGRGHRC
jgi:DNA-binding MarR family transcriptional regulator